MSYLSENELESLLLDEFVALGYNLAADSVIGPDGSEPERDAYSDVVLYKRLKLAVDRLNSHIPELARLDAIKQIMATERPSLLEENRRIHRLLVEGVPVEFYGEDGTIRGDLVQLLDFNQPANNDWMVSGQFSLVDGSYSRRPDVVVFLNGLPVAVVELKKPGIGADKLGEAFNQLQTYKIQVPSLFRTNALLIVSDGMRARVGSLNATHERFMPWRTIDGYATVPSGTPELHTLIRGVFEKHNLLNLIRNFTVFADGSGGTKKIVAGYHQFHAVKHAVSKTIEASSPAGDRKVGVIWHTQGSGKSYLMAFYAGLLVKTPELENPTILVVTDRNDLDDQLFSTFSSCKDLLRQTPEHVDNRGQLNEMLNRASGGVIFTTLQMFNTESEEGIFPTISTRRNIVVIADEAHRSQYGFRAKISNSGKISYGFAKYIRDAFPNASFVGFTGTPIESGDVNTPAIFGNYIDVYDISQAVQDGATVPIYYEGRLARIELPEENKPIVDEEISGLTEDDLGDEQERIKARWATVERLVGAEARLKLVAADIVTHFESRLEAMDGKAMVVCMSRRICVELYNHIVALRPQWHSSSDADGVVKVVMTGSAGDRPEWQEHIGNNRRRADLAKRAKDASDPLKLILVRDMWLTGFDAPSLHTMYVDKPMKGHGLMQAIARVNRVFKDKPAGLVVDYIGIAQSLRNALRDYSRSDQEKTGIDEREAVVAVLRSYEIVKAMFDGFNFSTGLSGSAQQRLAALAGAVEWILSAQHRDAAAAPTEEGKKLALRRYPDAVLNLSKAFALAAGSDEAKAIAADVGFFQAVRAALIGSKEGGIGTEADRDFAVQQILNRAVVSTEIIDIMRASGLQSPDISILSDEFLSEVQALERKNLALEALRRLLKGEIQSRARTNIVETKRFSERLEQAIARYHSNAITTGEVIQELIRLAKEMREALQRGEAEGLTTEEIAFYDALAENDSAVQILGNESLRLIAHELLTSLQNNITVDWAHRENARAKMRVLVKRILRKYGYPPDLQDAAVQTVLRQAEALSAAWVTA
ncbi:type I restriction endonuclease subunit R [Rhizobium calliandrae]|uniref:Type I restriction enzyme endonuclease subunit n=1 Tax=Rhizobium calliandrae TaxID=1312182 RepID=A0ABT7KQQ5_9HYPH|nr:type I restriction endonuclease subunit R [Rhizobium calliandrae]MDL2410432.1 type I restriction endonuclease subunit R [Rhizobium calliandrae]